MELLAARFADRADDHRPLGLVGAEIRRHDFQFRGHVRVGIHRLTAVAAGVNDVRAIRSDVESASARPVG